MLLDANAARLSIFAFYDSDGVVDDYIVYLLNSMRAFCTEQVVVVNGSLTPESEEKLAPCCTRILRRENEGFDITGYRDALLSAGDLSVYDEVLFFNQTVFGPVVPLVEMFSTMARRDVDFWGLSRHPGARHATWDYDAVIPPHLQSFFFAVRKPMLTSPEFLAYWQGLPKIESYWDAVSKHEVVFTKHFAELGYRWAPYLDTSDLDEVNDYPLMGMPAELLRRGCPFVKRKCFLCSVLEYASVPQGAASSELIGILRRSSYPLSLIFQNLLRTADIRTLDRAIQPYQLLPAEGSQRGRVAAVLWFASESMGGLLCEAALRITGRCELFCIFPSEALAERMAPRLPENAHALLSAQNGLTCIVSTLWPRLAEFDYLLYLNNALPPLLDQFSDRTSLSNAIASLIPERCAALLEQLPETGILFPSPCAHQECLYEGQSWSAVRPTLEPLLEQAGIYVPMAKKSSVAVRGSFFFARTAALAPLTHFAFTPALFEGEYPAAEYLLPLSAQSAGFFFGFACTPATLKMQLVNREIMLCALLEKLATPRKVRSDQILYRIQGILDFYNARHNQMTLEQAFAAKLSFKQKLWICAQILLKPETFAKLHKSAPVVYPEDPMD